MNNLLYLIAVILVIGWAVTYLGLGIATNLIHVLLVLAVVSVLFNVIRNGRLEFNLKIMKIIKNSLIAVVLLTVGFFSNTALAEVQSIVGQIIEGPEFIEIVASKDFKQFVHKNEIALVTFDPKNGSSAQRYMMTNKSGTKITLTLDQYDALVKQLDYSELKIG